MRSPSTRSWLSGLLAALLLAACASQPVPPAAAPAIPGQVSSAEWANDMARFAAEDAARPPPRGAVLFIGSSSIRLWQTLADDFPGTAVINRGFGGSEVRDSTWYADRIVTPYKPRTIIFYAGENDINAGRAPMQVLADVQAFVARVRKDLPGVRIGYLSIKPSPSRIEQLPQQQEANRMIRDWIATQQRLDFIDVATPMLGANGVPRPELFRADRLHMTADGYAIWRGLVLPCLQSP